MNLSEDLEIEAKLSLLNLLLTLPAFPSLVTAAFPFSRRNPLFPSDNQPIVYVIIITESIILLQMMTETAGLIVFR